MTKIKIRLTIYERHELDVGQLREAWIGNNLMLKSISCWLLVGSAALGAFWGNIAVARKWKAGICFILDHACARKYKNIEIQKNRNIEILRWLKGEMLIIDHGSAVKEQNCSFGSLSWFYRSAYFQPVMDTSWIFFNPTQLFNLLQSSHCSCKIIPFIT